MMLNDAASGPPSEYVKTPPSSFDLNAYGKAYGSDQSSYLVLPRTISGSSILYRQTAPGPSGRPSILRVHGRGTQARR